jgi:hypothetical protein
MQFQREVSHVRSQRESCSSSAGSGNSTHARAKSSPFSSPFRAFFDICGVFGDLWGFADFTGEESPGDLAALSFFAFFVFGTGPG